MQILLEAAPYLFVACIGASLGSFYRALADRILYYFYGPGRKANGRPIKNGTKWKLLLSDPSRCDHCGGRISVSRLLPVVGWLLGRGRCEHCRSRITVWHLMTELLFAVLAIAFLALTKSIVMTGSLLLFCGHLLVAMLTDWRRLTLDYENTAILLLLSIFTLWIQGGEALPHLMASAGVAAFFLLSYMVTGGRQPGFGDILLAAVLGFHHGFPWLLLPLQIGAAGSLLHLWLIKRNMKAAAPLGFYMAAGSIITMPLSLFLQQS